MRAELVPLKGKYYGTEVAVYDEAGVSTGHVVIWLNPTREADWKPSSREIEQYAFQIETEDLKEAAEDYEICDNHYETVLGLWVAQKLVDAING